MLEDCLIESRRSARPGKPFTLVVSVITHGSLVGALILIPLFQEHLLPHVAMFEPLPPPMVQTRVVDLVPKATPASSAAPTASTPTDLYTPVAIPKHIANIVDEPMANSAGFMPAGPGGVGNGPNIPGLSGLDLAPRVAAPPLPPPSPPPAPPKPPEPAPAPTVPLRRGGDVVKSNLVYQVQPVYPLLAQKTRTSGVVLLEAVILRDGTIDPARIRVITGNVLLNEAAIDAVKQWRYKPTLLNQEPVEILTTITINFSFN
jgi:protein TonB